jgi:hypothetical protein
MKILIFVLSILVTLHINAQSLDKYLMEDAQKVSTFNQNEIAVKIKNGTKYFYNTDLQAVSKMYIQNTGRKDYSGNDVLVPFIVQGKDTAFFYPEPWFHPVRYNVYSKSKAWTNLASDWKGASALMDTKHLVFQGSVELYKKIYDNNVYRRVLAILKAKMQNFLYDEFDKCIEMTNKYFQNAISEIKNNGYDNTLDKTLEGIFVTREVKYSNSTDRYNVKIFYTKVKKKYDANNKLSEIIFIFQFTDGSFPEKDEFMVKVKKNADGFFIIPENKWIYSGLLIPVNGTAMILNTKTTKYINGNNVPHVTYSEVLTKNMEDYNIMNTLKEFMGQGNYIYEYTDWYKKKNITMEYNAYTDKGTFDNFISDVFYPEVKKNLKK